MNLEKGSLQAPKSEMVESRLRLRRAREAGSKTPEQLGEIVSDVPSYHDLENCDGELYNNLSLGNLSRLCSALGIKPCELFGHGINAEQTISPEQLVFKTKEYLRQNTLNIAEFEARIGFEIGPSLNDASKVLDWNVDFLRWLCGELGLDWRLTLP